MTQQIYNPLAAFGFTDLHVQTLAVRLAVPQFVYVSGPAGGGKTKAALMVALTYFQTLKRPYRIDGQDMTTAQIKQAATERNHCIIFHDMASPHDYMRAGYCVDCRMIALGIAFDGPSNGEAAYAHLLGHLPTLVMRQDVTAIGVDRMVDDAGTERYQIDIYTS